MHTTPESFAETTRIITKKTEKTKRHPIFGCLSKKIKKPAAPYSRTGESRTTLGEGALDFRVRNGNGYDNSSMATGKSRKLES